MASNTGISTPTITASEWSNIQIMQVKAKAFLSAALGSAAKSNLIAFQKAFNAALPAIITSVGAGGGDPAAVKRLLGTDRIAEDGLWGPQSAIAMAITLWVSFPSNVWNTAAQELATPGVINKTSGATPLSRNLISTKWYPKWKNQVNGMVWKDFAGAVIESQKPTVDQANNNTVIKDAGSNQQNAENQLDAANGQPQPKTSTQIAINEGPVAVTGDVAGAKQFMWLWVTLGLGAVGGGLWYMFGRKAR